MNLEDCQPPRAVGPVDQHLPQFKARFLRTSPPTSTDGIEKYLSSGMIRGIGPAYAKKLLRAFGEKVFDVIEARRTDCARSTASGRFALPAFSLPGPNKRRCGKSWCCPGQRRCGSLPTRMLIDVNRYCS
jgi:hypothetical protein